MKIAYLILAHHRPSSLTLLTTRLDDGDAMFFVHVDAKTDDTPFRTAVPRATFVSDRIAVNWCGFSMVEATLRLIRTAYAAGADRFVLLSGVDYPMADKARIRSTVEQDVEYIQIDRRLDPEGSSQFDLCANRLFFGDMPALNPRSGSPRASRLAERLGRYLPRRRHTLPVYYGASWWALTREAIEEVMKVQRDRPRVIDAFRFTRSPDEMVFQTILMASPRRGKIAFDSTSGGFKPAANQAALHYADWDRPNPSLPRVLDKTDLGRLSKSRALFIRKTDSRSNDLLELLNEEQNSKIIPT